MTDDAKKVVPTWQKIAFALIAAVAFFLLLYTANLSRSGFAKQDAQVNSSKRNDCRAVIQAARRDVFDQLNLLLDIDRTNHDIYLGDALLVRVGVLEETDPELAAKYAANHDDLNADVALAATLIPSLPAVDDIVAHGGEIPVVHNDRTVTSVRFDPCPEVSS